MPSPRGQAYATLQDLKTYGLSAQFLNSPLLTQPSVTDGWLANQGFAANAKVIAVATPNGFYFEAITSQGSTGASEPPWPAQQGATVLDGSVLWQNMGVNTVANVALQGASDVVDAYLGPVFGLPLQNYGPIITRLACHIAALDVAMVRGFNPGNPAEEIFLTRARAAEAMLQKFADGRLSLNALGANASVQGATDPSLGPEVVSPALPGYPESTPTWAPGTRGTGWR